LSSARATRESSASASVRRAFFLELISTASSIDIKMAMTTTTISSSSQRKSTAFHMAS